MADHGAQCNCGQALVLRELLREARALLRQRNAVDKSEALSVRYNRWLATVLDARWAWEEQKNDPD